HVDRATVRYMAIRPPDVLARGCAGIGAHRRLGEQDVRLLRAPPPAHRVLRGSNLGEGPAEVDGTGAAAVGGAPRNWSVQRPISLEHAGAVAEAAKSANVRRG